MFGNNLSNLAFFGFCVENICLKNLLKEALSINKGKLATARANVAFKVRRSVFILQDVQTTKFF